MGRHPKKGLTFFYRDVDFYDDFKIEDLMNEFGPLGVTIYDVILCMIYHEGYYLEVPSLNHLAVKVIKTIGNRWVSKKDLVLQVVRYCADIGLFDSGLLNRNVITSAGVQQHYDSVTVRNKVNKDKYWLLEKEETGQPLLSAPSNGISATEKDISATEITINDAEKQQNKIKENKYIYFSNPELNNEFHLYLEMRERKSPLMPEQIEGLKQELIKIAGTDEERIQICHKAFVSGWNSFYPLKKKASQEPKQGTQKKPNQFHNFDQRNYDFDALEREFIEQVNKKEKDD